MTSSNKFLTMRTIRSICVYCGSREGQDPVYRREAALVGAGLAARGITLVFGAGGVGIMNVIADAVLDGGGDAIGVIPRHLAAQELKREGLTETVLVDTMHERKQIMFERADAFVVLPGGFGTLDEFFEMLTWKMLDLHRKPIFLVDCAGYWAPLAGLIDHVIAKGFADRATRDLISIVSGADGLLDAITGLKVEPGDQRRARLA